MGQRVTVILNDFSECTGILTALDAGFNVLLTGVAATHTDGSSSDADESAAFVIERSLYQRNVEANMPSSFSKNALDGASIDVTSCGGVLDTSVITGKSLARVIRGDLIMCLGV